MSELIIPIVNESENEILKYETELSAGLDLRANLPNEKKILKPLERFLVPTGIKLALPAKYEAQVRPRSGLALKHGITVLNSPGTVDADYRGGIGVILVNLSNEDFTIEHGDRIAQLVIGKFEKVDKFQLVENFDNLESTTRGENGFGHTGVK